MRGVATGEHISRRPHAWAVGSKCSLTCAIKTLRLVSVQPSLIISVERLLGLNSQPLDERPIVSPLPVVHACSTCRLWTLSELYRASKSSLWAIDSTIVLGFCLMARPYGDPVEIVTAPIPAQSPFIPADAKIVVGAVAPASPDPIPIVLLPGFEYRMLEWRHPTTHEIHWRLERRKSAQHGDDDE